MAGGWFKRSGGIVFALALMGQWLFFDLTTRDLSPFLVAASAGIGIFGAAFALSWAAEVAQLDVPESLSLALLALIAVLPEYAVDIYFAWEAGKNPAYTHFATANMTGANRILIGAGWPAVILAYWWKSGERGLTLGIGQRNELGFLLAATVYAFVIPIKGTLSIFDSLVLVGLFVVYIRTAAASEMVEPELGGSARALASLTPLLRRLATVALFLLAGSTIFLAAKPFAESLLAIGRSAGIEEFLLVQWLAPIASESPEFIIAVLFALRLKPGTGFSALLSSKVNQWTLLVGMLPLAFALSAHSWGPMVLDGRQSEEILLTAAQSLFACVLIADLRFDLTEAVVLLVLFLVQLLWPDPWLRAVFIGIYVAASAILIAIRPDIRRSLLALLRHKQSPA